MNLQEQLNNLREKSKKESPKHAQESNERVVKELKEKKLAQKGPKVGEKIENFRVEKAFKKAGDKVTNFSLPDAMGNLVDLKSLLKKGTVVLNFYRGGWCPYCNLELRALQRALPEFEENQAQLVAISPESPDNSISTAEKLNLDFLILSDIDSKVAEQFGIVYIVPDYLKASFEKFGLDLAQFNNADVVKLPLPATYVIDKDMIIRFAFANEDFTQRADVDKITKTVEKINNE